MPTLPSYQQALARILRLYISQPTAASRGAQPCRPPATPPPRTTSLIKRGLPPITGQPITPTGVFVSGYQYLYSSSITAGGFRHNDQPVIGISPTDPNTVYALWTDGRWDTSFVYQGGSGKHADIAFSRSTDGGAT